MTPVLPEAQGNRVDYRRPGLGEWYVNGPLGLEQGFTLDASPCLGTEGRSVVIELRGGGDLRAEVSAQGDMAQLRDAQGDEVLRYSDLYVVDATGRQLAAAIEATAEGMSIHVDDAGAVYPIEVDPRVWTQQAKLTANDGGIGESFGTVVAVDGNTAAVTAPNRVANTGAVYVFVRTGNTWTQQAELLGAPNEDFGKSLSLDGRTLLVGAPFAGDGHQGAAYVFVRTGNTWAQQAVLTANDATFSALFGFSVAVDGNTAAVGAPFAGAGGAAYVFVRTGATWTQRAELLGAPDDQLGFSVALDGRTLVAGAPNHAIATGAAYVFVGAGTTWTQQAILTPDDGAPGDTFGNSVTVDGNTVGVGAEGHAAFAGAVYVFARSGKTWTQQAEFIGAPGDVLGISVSLDGSTLVAGAPGNANATGAVYVFVRTGKSWSQQALLTANGGVPGDELGESVAIDGNTILAGAPGTAGNTGAAYVFVRRGGNGHCGDPWGDCSGGDEHPCGDGDEGLGGEQH